MPDTVIIPTGETPVVTAPAVPTVQETVEAAVAVAAAVERAAERVAEPDAELSARIVNLENELRNSGERIANLGGQVQTLSEQIAALTVAQTVAAVEEEIEEAAPVVLPPVEVVPPESIPTPEAPAVRTKKKRYFL